MLEIRNVTKIYHSKAGNDVRALDNVSMTLPERGMVFILGKSGSGKSTLLNVIGGLDGCDSGEFIIKGKSSKEFAGADFDSYRNTFIGFIFQEYNILDEFTVGANIALALELQGKKATNEQINAILGQVDLLDYAKRKPNELSGGQKQRVAIARALVKDPEIIMADEPTGALDSNTGKQIFDTLKELSKTKLVVVVSHDRDFAEKYADRIIEMKDGRIDTDVTRHEVAATAMSEGILKMSDHLLRIEKGYQLTSRDVELINAYLRQQNAEILISGDKRLNDNVRSAAGISQNNTSSVFDATDSQRDVRTKEYSKQDARFIRSKLPMKNALKMGSSGLKHKKFRLVMTILLSLIAFALFGFADTLGGYKKITAATDSILDSNVQNASFSFSLLKTVTYGEESYSHFSSTAMNDEDLKNLRQETGIDFVPVFTGSEYADSGNISLSSALIDQSDISHASVYSGALYGLVDLKQEKLASLGFTITGRMPEAPDEIAISELTYRQFNHTGFQNTAKKESVKAGQLNLLEKDPNSILGKHLTLSIGGVSYTFRITAVIDTGFDYNRYANYVPSKDEPPVPDQNGNELVDMIMINELQNTLRYGFHALGYVTNGALEPMAAYMKQFSGISDMGSYLVRGTTLYTTDSDGNELQLTHLNRVAQSSDIPALGSVTWFDGRTQQTLAEGEMLISSSILNQILRDVNLSKQINEALQATYGSAWNEKYGDQPISSILTQLETEAYINDPAVFASAKAELAQGYQSRYGMPHENDEQLKEFWRTSLRDYDLSALPSSTKDPADLTISGARKLYGVLFDRSTEGLSDEFFQYVVDSFLAGTPKQIFFSSDRATELLCAEYAYRFLESNPSLSSSEEFYNTVISPSFPNRDEWDRMTAEDQRRLAANLYTQYVCYSTRNGEANPFDQKSYADFSKQGEELFFKIANPDLSTLMQSVYLKFTDWENGMENVVTDTSYRIVGVYSSGTLYLSDLVISDTLYEENRTFAMENFYGFETSAPHEPGIYAFAIAPMPRDRATVQKLVEMSYDESGSYRFELQNQVMNTLSSFNDFIGVGAKIFLYIGIGFAVFSSLMLMNFISVSISYKKREIGILRAVGARSSDVFKIFFSEAAIIALINYVLALAATVGATVFFNTYVRRQGVNITLLSFGIRQVLLMLVISVAVAALASFLPVWNIARRKPVDAIKDK